MRVGRAKEKWPSRWCGRLGGGIRYGIIFIFYFYFFINGIRIGFEVRNTREANTGKGVEWNSTELAGNVRRRLCGESTESVGYHMIRVRCSGEGILVESNACLIVGGL